MSDSEGKSKNKSCLFVALGILIIPILGFIYLFSTWQGIIAKEVKMEEQWSQVDVSLLRRADLIPNLVNTVKGYAQHEEKIFQDVSNARASMLAAGNNIPAKAAAEASLNSALGRLMAISEAYPNLKANENFLRLQDELAGTENRIAVARSRYNESVREFNITVKQFPGNIICSVIGKEPASFFQAPSSAQVEQTPNVQF